MPSPAWLPSTSTPTRPRLCFADESRIWIKSHWGQAIRELPRKDSIFDLVLAEDGPVVVPDISAHPQHDRLSSARQKPQRGFFCQRSRALLRRQDSRNFDQSSAKSPARRCSRKRFASLESLADMVSSQLELRRLRKTLTENGKGPRRAHHPLSRPPTGAGHARPICTTPWTRASSCSITSRRVDLATRRIVGLEALIRWAHPERGLIPPMDFIPLAEESGLILPIGDWGLGEACSQIQKWCDEDPRHASLRVGVNLSARQFSREGLADHVEALLVQSGISSRQLGLEMTESSIIPNMRIALEVLGSLRRLGVSLLMDDFGTGYSSLSYLHSFPFDVLKIDRSFVGRMTEGDQPLQIVRTIIELARVLGMDVVAEGIETREQYRLLREMGCRYGQGYLFARPMSAEAVTQLLRLPGRVLPEPEFAELVCA